MGEVSPSQYRLATTSTDEAAALLSGAYAPVKVWTPASAFDLEVKGVAVEGLAVFKTASGSGVVFDSESSFDGYNLAVPVSGAQTVDIGSAESISHRSDHGLVVDGSQVTRVSFLGGLDFRGLSINSEVMHRALAEQLDGAVHMRVRFRPLHRTDSPAIKLALSLGDALYEGLSGGAPLAQAPAALLNLRQSIVHLLLSGLPHNYSEQLNAQRRPLPAPRHVTRAIDFMRANAALPITMTDVARAASVSVRALQSGFRQFRATTPTNYLRHLRLERARDDLRNPGMPRSVSDIALRWGFAHMGLFAAHYKATFGESPNVTLRRSVDRPES